jgi:hypothetical protein
VVSHETTWNRTAAIGLEGGFAMYRRLARVVLPLVVLAVIAALTIGLDGNCSGMGDWVVSLI